MPAPSPTRMLKAAARGVAAAPTLLAAALPALAQAPAALQEIREPERPAISRPETAAPLADPAALTVPVGATPRVRVAGFRISGASLVAEEDILATLAPHAGPALGAAELQLAARAVAALYLQQGHLARIAVRSVSVAEGVAHLEVHELRLGNVRVEVAEGARLDAAIAGPFLTARLAPGSPLPLAHIQAGVALLNAQPGIEAAVALDPGASDDEVDLVLHLRDRPLWSGRLALDNHGIRELGQERLRLALQADNAFGMADRSGLRVEKSAGSEILLPSFSLALGGRGMRIGVEALAFRYQARRAGLPLGLEGDQQEWRIFVSTPLLRAGGTAMEGRLGAERVAYRDDSLFGELRRRRLGIVQLGV
ncbi:MAG: ShlB/FhaC/HecB family hemolysin secretion/activation protein, partial [Rhodocyclaceae bacterium]|nr:ShlB/FhaC/HecB family hemolysin secretion/activation protein [Rhodocyclaceae bacterium]